MARIITAPSKFKVLVANLEGSGDPSRGRNPVKLRTGFQLQVFTEIPRESNETRVGDPQTPGLRSQTGLLTSSVPGVPVGGNGTITVSSNDFTAQATLFIGVYSITSGVDYTVGGSTALTAAAIATAINNLPQFSANAVLSDITVTGPFGPDGDSTKFEAQYRGSVRNFTISPNAGFLVDAEPYIGPIQILS